MRKTGSRRAIEHRRGRRRTPFTIASTAVAHGTAASASPALLAALPRHSCGRCKNSAINTRVILVDGIDVEHGCLSL